jgi:SAM-dependent methyltransferase
VAIRDVVDVKSCPYCDGNRLELLFDGVTDRLRFVPGSWTFLQCADCRSAVLSPKPTDERLGSLYPPIYTFSTAAGGAAGLVASVEYRLFFHPQYRTQVATILKALGTRSAGGRRLLDVGCGRGHRLPLLQASGFTVEATDLEPEVVAFVARQFGIRAVVSDVADLTSNFKPASFDVVTAFYVLEHVPDVHAALAAYYALMKPGGLLVVAVPFVDGLQPRLFGRRWSNTAEAPRHLSIPSHAGLQKACETQGFADCRFYPDSSLQSAANIALSVIPGGATTSAYGSGGLAALGLRALGAVVTLATIPISLIHRNLTATPSFGILAARKPAG